MKYIYSGIECICSSDNVHIIDSFEVTKIKSMIIVIKKLRNEFPRISVVHDRSIFSLIIEWRAHNLLYDFGLFKSRTKDVDLNYPKWYFHIIYFMLSLIYLKW